MIVVSSETTIGVALMPALFALCAHCEVLVKDRDDGLIAAFFATLAQEDPSVAARASAQAWTGGEGEFEDGAFARAGAVVAFGRDATLAAIRARTHADTRFVAYGHRASIGYVDAASLSSPARASELASAIARDVVLYDGEGCMSLHALFVEPGGTIAPETFAEHIAQAIAVATIEFPSSILDASEQARLGAYRSNAAFRSALGATRTLVPPGTDATVVLAPPYSEPPPFLGRTLPIYVVDGPAQCSQYLQRHGLKLEAAALAASSSELIDIFVENGAVRIAHLGEMQRPGPAVHHGGRMRIAEFVRWIENEW